MEGVWHNKKYKKSGTCTDGPVSTGSLPSILEDNPLAPLPMPSPGSQEPKEILVESCSSVYVFLTFLGSLAFLITECLYSWNGNIVYNRAKYLSGPASIATFGASVFLQPRNKQRSYIWLLRVQFFLSLFLPHLVHMALNGFTFLSLAVSALFGLIGLGQYIFAMYVRSRAAKLSDKRLSFFMTDSVLIQILSLLGTLAFFALDPIKCWIQYPISSNNICERTIIGQAGLCSIVLVQVAFTVMNGVFPEKTVAACSVTLHKVATGKLSLREKATFCVNTLTMCCAFFLFSQYNARSEINEGERNFLLVVAALGSSTLFVMRAWGWWTLSHKVENKDDGQEQGQDNSPRHVVKLSRNFRCLAIIIAWGYASLGVMLAMTLKRRYASMQHMLAPFMGLSLVVDGIADPRAKSSCTRYVAYLGLMLSEVPSSIYQIRIGVVLGVFGSLFRVAVFCLLLKFANRFRRRLSNLDDSDLSNFFLETVLKNVTSNITAMLFVTFRSTNCVISKNSFSSCRNTILCSTFISIYCFSYITTSMVMNAWSGQKRSKYKLSWEKVASLTNINTKHILLGVLIMLTCGSGMLLFCMMQAADSANESIILGVGSVGTFSCLCMFALELRLLKIIILKRQVGEEVTENKIVVEVRLDKERRTGSTITKNLQLVTSLVAGTSRLLAEVLCRRHNNLYAYLRCIRR